MSINVALVANKNTLKAAEHSTNIKLQQLEKEGNRIVEVKTSAFPVVDAIDKTQIKLLWLSTITYEKNEEPKPVSTLTTNIDSIEDVMVVNI